MSTALMSASTVKTCQSLVLERVFKIAVPSSLPRLDRANPARAVAQARGMKRRGRGRRAVHIRIRLASRSDGVGPRACATTGWATSRHDKDRERGLRTSGAPPQPDAGETGDFPMRSPEYSDIRRQMAVPEPEHHAERNLTPLAQVSSPKPPRACPQIAFARKLALGLAFRQRRCAW
jgi:hypothetical protein